MLDTIKGLFSKIAEIFKKEEVAITEKVEPTIQKGTPKESQNEKSKDVISTKEIKEEKEETKVKVTNEIKSQSRENREKKFEHSPIVDKDIWE